MPFETNVDNDGDGDTAGMDPMRNQQFCLSL